MSPSSAPKSARWLPIFPLLLAGCASNTPESSPLPAAMPSKPAAPAKPAIAPTYTAKTEKFALWLPGKPEEKTQSSAFEGKPVNIKLVALTSLPVSYLVLATPIPASVSTENAESFFDGVQKGFLAPMNAKATQTKPLTLNGHPGRQIVGKGMNQNLRSHIFLAPGRSYQIVAFAPAADWKKNSAQIDKVFNSFQILD